MPPTLPTSDFSLYFFFYSDTLLGHDHSSHLSLGYIFQVGLNQVWRGLRVCVGKYVVTCLDIVLMVLYKSVAKEVEIFLGMVITVVINFIFSSKVSLLDSC